MRQWGTMTASIKSRDKSRRMTSLVEPKGNGHDDEEAQLSCLLPTRQVKKNDGDDVVGIKKGRSEERSPRFSSRSNEQGTLPWFLVVERTI